MHVARRVLAEKGNASVITGTNVFAHVDNLREFMTAVNLALAVAGDLYVHDLQRGTVTRLTRDAALNRQPVWTPDSQHIVLRHARMHIVRNRALISVRGSA